MGRRTQCCSVLPSAVLCPLCSPQSCGTAEEHSPERDSSYLPNGETEARRWAFGEHNGMGFHSSSGLQPHLPGFVANPEGFFPLGTSETISHLLLFLLWAGFQWRDRSVERMSDKSRADPAGILLPKSPSLRKHIPHTHSAAPCLTLGSFCAILGLIMVISTWRPALCQHVDFFGAMRKIMKMVMRGRHKAVRTGEPKPVVSICVPLVGLAGVHSLGEGNQWHCSSSGWVF